MRSSPKTESDPVKDAEWMNRALELARHGIGLCSPNPVVGCVVLDRDGKLAGEGWHVYDRRDHAEVVALGRAGERARGGTAYVTLEPCNHTGRTGPCSLALVAAGVARVVAATEDPNPDVAGRGLETLRQAGIAVEVGIVRAAAQGMNEGFARWIVSRKPFVHMKVAMSADDKIAPAVQMHREPFWITGEAARAEVQRMRWTADAVLTGVGTVLADDPLLTDRSGLARRRPLLRVVLDSGLRMPLDAKLVSTAANGDLLVFTVRNDAARIEAFRRLGVRVEVLVGEDGRVPLAPVLEKLGAEEVVTVLTETGMELNTALLAAGLVDRLTVFRSRLVLGEGGIPAFRGVAIAGQLETAEALQVGEDVQVSVLLRDPWEVSLQP